MKLLINGSPKGENSNTMVLTRAFIEGAGWTDVEIVSTAKADIKGCMGCFACWKKTPGVCVIKDSMGEVIPKLIAADTVIWSFPLYYFSVPGALKNLIDRQLPLNLPYMSRDKKNGGHPKRYDMSHQKHIVISTCGFWTAENNYKAVTAMFDHMNGAGKYAAIFCAQGEHFRQPEQERTKIYLDIVRRAGAEYATGGILPNTSAELAKPMLSREVFESMADASWA